jgi:hypothetical protein
LIFKANLPVCNARVKAGSVKPREIKTAAAKTANAENSNTVASKLQGNSINIHFKGIYRQAESRVKRREKAGNDEEIPPFVRLCGKIFFFRLQPFYPPFE